jgi:NitT/TauT family transport system substrate-binding protein
MATLRRHLNTILATGLAVALSATGGCAAAEDSGLDQITYVTAFGAVGRDAFAWVAREKGFFAQAGLDVDIQPGSGTGGNLQLLAAGQAEFVSGDTTGVMIETANGNHEGLRIISAIHQSTLVAIISLEGNGITRPQDLAGRRIGAGTASVNQLLFPAYARLAGIDENAVEWVNAPPPQLPTLLASGQVDALSTFLIGRVGIENAAERPAVVLPYSDYLPDLFGNGITTSQNLIDRDPDLVVRFRDAMLRALAYTVEHPQEAAEILAAANPDSSVAAAVGEISAMAASVTSAGTIGAMDRDRVAGAIAVLAEIELIPDGLAPEDFVDFDLIPEAGR